MTEIGVPEAHAAVDGQLAAEEEVQPGDRPLVGLDPFLCGGGRGKSWRRCLEGAYEGGRIGALIAGRLPSSAALISGKRVLKSMMNRAIRKRRSLNGRSAETRCIRP